MSLLPTFPWISYLNDRFILLSQYIGSEMSKSFTTKSLLHICQLNLKVFSCRIRRKTWYYTYKQTKYCIGERQKLSSSYQLKQASRFEERNHPLFFLKGKSADIVTSWWDSIQGIGENTCAQWHQFSRWFNSLLLCWRKETSDPWFTSNDSHAAPETMFPRLLANDEWSRLYSRPHWFDLCDRDPIKMAIKSTQPLYR